MFLVILLNRKCELFAQNNHVEGNTWRCKNDDYTRACVSGQVWGLSDPPGHGLFSPVSDSKTHNDHWAPGVATMRAQTPGD